jgi:ABC-type transport system involved in multi-copper enzyme maturation permease subunit
MKIRVIALNTLAGLLRNKIIILFSAIFICVLLLMLAPLTMMKAMSAAGGQAETVVLGLVAVILSLVSGFGSLLAAWASADAVAGELRSGTVLAVLARPVRRWEFLLGKYLGVQLLMCIYVLWMFAFSYLLAWIGGQHIHSAPWVLIVYPMVRYAIYSAIAVLLVTMMHPVVAFGIVLVISVVSSVTAPTARSVFPVWLKTGVYAVLPSAGLLDESRFLSITQASLKPTPWSRHAIAVSYGLDYALVCFLVGVWLFRRRSLIRE